MTFNSIFKINTIAKISCKSSMLLKYPKAEKTKSIANNQKTIGTSLEMTTRVMRETNIIKLESSCNKSFLKIWSK